MKTQFKSRHNIKATDNLMRPASRASFESKFSIILNTSGIGIQMNKLLTSNETKKLLSSH